MSDFIEIKKGDKPQRLINIHQIADVSVTTNKLRLRMSHGESIYLDMDYDDLLKLINLVASTQEEPAKLSVKFL